MRGYGEDVYKMVVATPDEAIAEQAAAFADPPVKVED